MWCVVCGVWCVVCGVWCVGVCVVWCGVLWCGVLCALCVSVLFVLCGVCVVSVVSVLYVCVASCDLRDTHICTVKALLHGAPTRMVMCETLTDGLHVSGGLATSKLKA